MKIFFIFLLCIVLNAKEFKVASYNVENFFDLTVDGTEYKEFNPAYKQWTASKYQTKLSNTIQVINDLQADILALQEIESQVVLDALQKGTNYKYATFLKNPKSAVGVGLLTNFPITLKESIMVDRYDKYTRPILKTTISIENSTLIIYINHWKSKRTAESTRIPYALALKNDIDQLNEDQDYIILGDLNSDYDEFLTFRYNKKLNDTRGITGINQILNTTINQNFVRELDLLQNNINQKIHYNLWLELDKQNRFSAKFAKKNQTPDNIIVSQALYDTKNISYIDNSFGVFKPSYLYKNNKTNRWNHKKASGYSDHLPIYAWFDTKQHNHKTNANQKTYDINYLYTIENLINPIDLYNAVVIYKSEKLAVIKQRSKKAITIYKPNKSLKLGHSYTLTASKIEHYNGNKQIRKIDFIGHEKKVDLDQGYYIRNTTNLKDEKNLNEIVQNLIGIYKKRKFYYDDKSINIYFQKGLKRPIEGKRIKLHNAQITLYKNNLQLTVYKDEDWEYLN